MKIVVIVAVACLFGCAQPEPTAYQAWSGEPTPSIWRLGDDWYVVVRDEAEVIVRTLVVRFGSEKARTCNAEEWKTVEIVHEMPPRSAAFLGVPAFKLKGRMLKVDLTANLCDNSTYLFGHLTELGWTGVYETSHMLGGETLGDFVAIRADWEGE